MNCNELISKAIPAAKETPPHADDLCEKCVQLGYRCSKHGKKKNKKKRPGAVGAMAAGATAAGETVSGLYPAGSTSVGATVSDRHHGQRVAPDPGGDNSDNYSGAVDNNNKVTADKNAARGAAGSRGRNKRRAKQKAVKAQQLGASVAKLVTRLQDLETWEGPLVTLKSTW